jgi:beta-glucosidase/6-phospho-beta-glucosidase/beta-galactosidase
VKGTPALEVWGGVECSVVRTGGKVRNQLADTGHFERAGDLDLIAGLGLKSVRYPVLWELVEQRAGRQDWSWTDQRLTQLKDLEISPVAGLLHHGSGPEWTDLCDPRFPELLAEYAGRVAERYPWIGMYTPVNEPFTTARISGLYGLWHPHGTNEAMCFRITVAECRAIALAMKSIRRINPEAKLIQTEDFGRIYATPALASQAAYENQRRWLAVDLLTGQVDKNHPLFKRLLEAGVNPSHLAELRSEPCPPDCIGIDYYLTSDRLIDERAELYPGEKVGGNGRQSYVDIAAVRSDIPHEKTGLASRVVEVWERYGLPIIITELHNGCTRDEHLRWFMEGWNTANKLRLKGVDIRAVTSWSLFGACDWNSMLTRRDGYYECGAFDARYVPPQPTIVATAISHLTRNGKFDHPVLDRPGWWHSDDTQHHAARPLVLAGFERLASTIEECCSRRRLPIVAAGTGRNGKEIMARHNAWGLVRIEHRQQGNKRRGEPVRLHCEYDDGAGLSLELPPSPDWRSFADTFLDLVVDRRSGALRCVSEPLSTVMSALVEVHVEQSAAAKNSAA